jgi:hypothetical protein
MLRWRKHDHVHNLYVAVQRYVHANGGTIAVIGGLEVQDFLEGESKFKVAVRCLGKRPQVAKAEGRASEGK